MRKTVLAVVLALAVEGCATAPPDDAAQSAPPPSAGRTALSIIGTPFLLAFKVPACVVSAAVAAPLAGAAQLAGSYQGERLEDNLGNGLEKNCGPPYVLTP